jgi:hypothetical protein
MPSALSHDPAITVPGASTDNAIVIFDGTGGTGFGNSTILVDSGGNGRIGIATDTNIITLTNETVTIAGAITGVTALTVDNININGNTISSTAGTDLLITPLAGQQLILDGTIIIDAGVVTAATSITSTEFVGGGVGLTALNGTQITTGTVADARISALTASKLTGALPAISGANLTNLPAGGAALTGSTNNTVVTVTGADAMQGESTLTYTGTAMMIGLAASPPTPDHTSVHIWEGSAGSLTSSTDMQLVVENSGNAGIAILSPNANSTQVAFGSPQDNRQGGILYDHNTNSLQLRASGVTKMTISSAGEVTMPNQPAFTAMNTVSDSNVTGNTTSFAVVDFNAEIFDQGGDFASDTFTAPVTGRYLLTGQARLFGYTAAANEAHNKITTSNRTYVNIFQAIVGAYSEWSHPITALVDMDAADTATLSVRIRGESSNIVDIYGDSDQTDLQTFFSGYLVA